MKKFLLKSVVCTLLIAAFASCSPESAVDLTNDTSAVQHENQKRSSLWNGEIGMENNGVYEITTDKNVLLADLQGIADKNGGSELVTLEIVKKQALNDVNDSGYILIAGDYTGFSIGVQLNRTSGGKFMTDGFQGANPVAVNCKGCASGCNLQYLYIEGKRYPICNENGCVADCTKSETGIE